MFDLAGSTILATKKNLDLATSIERQDYYVSIKDVIERINRRQNAVESTAADRYRRAISRHGFRKLRSANDLLKEVSSNLDLSWKDGGTHFPKKSSSIGENYQVSSIPVAGSCGEIDNPGSDI